MIVLFSIEKIGRKKYLLAARMVLSFFIFGMNSRDYFIIKIYEFSLLLSGFLILKFSAS